MRKSRASHVKCDCGEKTHKCVHLKTTVEGHKGERPPPCSPEPASVAPYLTHPPDSCCCNHGGRCTCCHKKEPPHLDTVPESESDRDEVKPSSKAASPKAVVRRRRANTAQSEGALSFDENGHHKPPLKHTKASQKHTPYQLGRTNSARAATASNRSVDNLRGESRRDREGSSGSGAAVQDQRQVRSETGSPLLPPTSFGQLNSQLPPLDLSGIEYQPYVPNGFDMFSSVSDTDHALFSAGLSGTPVDWSHYDLDFNTSRTAENFAPSNYSQPQSYSGFEFNGSEQAPTLTTTNSGEASEAEDLLGPNPDDYETAAFGTSAPSAGFHLTTGQTLLSRGDAGLDFNRVKLMRASNQFLPTPTSATGDELSLTAVTTSHSFAFDDDPPVWMPEYHHGLPTTRDSPDPGMLPFSWDHQ